jgi:DNA-binding response OmpR family regulator
MTDGRRPKIRAATTSRAPAQHLPVVLADATVLVVDPDAVSRRFVELALASDAERVFDFAVETVRDAASAFEVLHASVVDLIVAETDLGDMSGMHFYKRLHQESRLRSLPFVFLSADRRSATKVVALRAGVDDYVDKPCEPLELMARIAGLIERQRRTLAAQRRRAYTLAGEFSTLPFPDLISILELSRRTGSLTIATSRAQGEICLRNGQPVHAAFGNLLGPESFYQLMGESSGQFEFSVAPADPAVRQTIDEPVTALVMEGARRLDDRRAKGGGRSAPPSIRRQSVAPRVRSSMLPPEPPLPALAPSRTIGAHFELGISDAYSLGELQLFSQNELARWTRAPGGRERLHIHLLSDLVAGVAAFLSVASPVAERWVVTALSDEPKTLGLSFFLRQERLLDVTLIEVQKAASVQKGLRLCPAVTILAPPHGDFLALGTGARLQLETLCKTVPPGALFGIGNAALEQPVKELAMKLSIPAHSCRRGALGDAQTDFRALLTAAVRLWASSGESSGTPTSAAAGQKGKRG